MESRDFDSFTKSVAASSSRRRVFQGTIGALLGGVAVRLGLSDGEAAKRKKGKQGNGKRDKKPNACAKFGRSCKKPRHGPKPTCCSGSVCKDDRCDCRPGTRRCGKECIRNRKNICCRDNECPGNQQCIKHRCDCPKAKKLCNGDCIPTADVCVTRVTPSNLHGWIRESEDGPPKSTPAMAAFVSGPDTPPIGTGSVQIQTLIDADQATLRTLKYQGTKLTEITELGYSVYSSAGAVPNMQFAVTGLNSVDNFASLVYIPGVDGNPPLPAATWTPQSPLTGFWRSSRDVLGPNDECLVCRGVGNNQHIGDCVDPPTCAAVDQVTWEQILAAMPNAAINDRGSFSIRMGTSDIGNGNVTGIQLNKDLYFFESD